MNASESWFGQRLKVHRERARFTQLKLAEEMKVSLQTVREWERGDKFPHLRKLPRLAQLLGVTPGSFFPGEDDDGWPDRLRETPPPLDPGLRRLEGRLEDVLEELRGLRRTWGVSD